MVAARKLHEAGKRVRVLLLADPAEVKGDAAEMLRRLPVEPAIARNEQELAGEAAQGVLAADLLVDAILGTGFKPPVSEFYAAVFERMEGACKVCVDVPSGADADARMPTHSGRRVEGGDTVTFTAPKPIHVYSPAMGTVVVAEIGSPPEAIVSASGQEVITNRETLATVAPRVPWAHKGDFGHVLIIGGSLGKAGAAAMAGMAALRAGAGLVTVACPRPVLATVAGFAPEIMTEPLPETEQGSIALAALDYGLLDKLLAGKTVVAIGPGASQHPETAQFIRTAVKRVKVPVVLDADGLNAFDGHTDELNGRDRQIIITPHPGEMSRLTGLPTDVLAGKPEDWMHQERHRAAQQFADQHEVTVVLKGHRTVIARPGGDCVWVNTTGNAGMATGGTGDILTGIMAACVAREWRRGRKPPAEPSRDFGEAVLSAVYLHGLAGDFAAERYGEHCMAATDLMRSVPPAFSRAGALPRSRFTWVRGAHLARLGC